MSLNRRIKTLLLSAAKPYDLFLGGTCNGSTWREELIELLDDNVNYFNQ